MGRNPQREVSFWSRVAVIDDEDSCWLFTGYIIPDEGYGKVGGELAHRRSWELNCGPIPEGIQVLHKCDNRPCVRPRHLFLGTHQDNMDDMHAKGRAHTRGSVNRDGNGPKLNMERARAIRERY